MQTLINNISDNFSDYHSRLNSMYNEKTKQWDALFDKRTYNNMHRGITYVVQEFLSNNDVNQLFIQIPTDKLGRSESAQEKNLVNIQKLFLDISYLITEDPCTCLPLEECKEGEQYFCGESIWNIKSTSQTECGLRPSDPTRGALATQDAINEYKSEYKSGIKVQGIKTAGLDKKEVKHLIKLSIKKLRKHKEALQEYHDYPRLICNPYKKVAIVGKYWDFMRDHHITNENIPSNVEFHTSCETLFKAKNTYDLIILLWDTRYKYSESKIKYEMKYGRVKKVIYLGKNIFESFHNNPNVMHYAFTFREIFTYYNSANFPTFKFIKKDATSIVGKYNAIEQHIPQNMLPDEKQKICQYALWNLMKMDQEPIDIEKFTAFLSSSFPYVDMSDFDALIDYVQQIECDINNPKSVYYRDLGRNTFKIVTCESFIRRLAETKNTNNIRYVIDALLSGKSLVENVIKQLLIKGRLGEYHILTYNNQIYLEQFFKQEVEIYKDRAALTKIQYNYISHSTGTVSFLDRLDASISDIEDLFESYGRQMRTDTYRCKIDGQVDLIDIDGNIIYDQNFIKIDEIYESQDLMLPCRITYYKKPANLQQIIELYVECPKGCSIDMYSKLWKEKMIHVYENIFNKDIEQMRTTFNTIAEPKLKSFVTGKYKSHFPEETRAIVETLFSLKAINEEERKRIINTAGIIGSYSKYAKDLKESLFHYLTTQEIKGFLEKVLGEAAKRGMNTNTYLDQIINDGIVQDARLLEITRITHND